MVIEGYGKARFAPTYRRMLMLKDVPLADFSYNCETGYVTYLRRLAPVELFPLGCRDRGGAVSRPAMARWLSSRGVPRTRRTLDRVLAETHLESPEELLLIGRGLSLTDCYWFRAEGDSASWADVNFFENDFSPRLGLALAPHDDSSAAAAIRALADSDIAVASSQSPDAALNGELTKRWRVGESGVRELLKGGREARLYQEPYGEVVATALCRRILTPGEYVPYGLFVQEGDAGVVPFSKCAAMTSPSLELVPAVDVSLSRPAPTELSAYESYVRALEAEGVSDARAQVDRMLVVDYLLANSDRHWGNFGVLVDPDSREWLRPAPIYDTGTSLWCELGNVSALAAPESSYPMPFLRRPDLQLEYVSDLSWLEPSALVGFAEEAAEILRGNELLAALRPRRLLATKQEIQRRVDAVVSRINGHSG